MTSEVILEEQHQGILRLFDACIALRRDSPKSLVEMSVVPEFDAAKQSVSSHYSKFIGRIDKSLDVDVLVVLQHIYVSVMPAGGGYCLYPHRLWQNKCFNQLPT